LFTKSELHSIAEIEKLIGELQEARDFLQSEGERVRRETERYTNLTQTASASVKIISDTVAGWREAGHPLRNQPRSGEMEVTPSPAEDVTGSLRAPDQQSPQSQGQIRGRSRGKEPLK
jgi:prophage DNA circulation protein